MSRGKECLTPSLPPDYCERREPLPMPRPEPGPPSTPGLERTWPRRPRPPGAPFRLKRANKWSLSIGRAKEFLSMMVSR
jgi:hypothetical protein